MLFVSKATNLRLNTKEGTVIFTNGIYETNDKKMQQAIKDTIAFKNNEITVVDKMVNGNVKQGNNAIK